MLFFESLLAHLAGDYWVNAAKAVSTFHGVSLLRGSRRPPSVRGSVRVSRLVSLDRPAAGLTPVETAR
jgi:hypothetical protein